ncbi:hypothetical protein [Mesorhizobium sp. KR1-2]|uniref:hypothetical protein n=1 Tax=Mesorhizobium sp. KR1-2 TaxID=3156609 RepID=UPI0032B36A5F
MPIMQTAAQKWLRDITSASRLIMPDLLARERFLSSQKWFGYRFMSPLAATLLFAKHYREGYKQYLRFNVDAELARNATGISLNVPEKPCTAFTQLWIARQKADERGLPYDLIIRFGFEFAGRRRRKNPPRPIQLFSNSNTEDAWNCEIEKYLEEHLPLVVEQLSELPQYRLEHDRGLPTQVEFREFMWTYTLSSDKPWSNRIGQQCIERRQLPLRRLLAQVERSYRRGVLTEVRHSRRHGSFEPAAQVDLPPIAFAPACLGLPASYMPASSECTNCPFAAKCGVIAASVSERMICKHGTVSPIANARLLNRREKTRERVRKHRLNKKACLVPAENRV